MNPLATIVRSNVRLARWISRGLSILSIGFYISLILFNEDVRSALSLPFLIYGLIVIAFIVSWIKERTGGLAAMVATALLGIVMIIDAFTEEDITLITVLVGTVILLLPNFLIAWLFFTIGQEKASLPDTLTEDKESSDI